MINTDLQNTTQKNKDRINTYTTKDPGGLGYSGKVGGSRFTSGTVVLL